MKPSSSLKNETGELKILLVEDNDGDFVLVREYLKEVKEVGAKPVGQYSLTRAVRLNEAIQKLQNENISIILLDLTLPDAQGFEAFDRLQLLAPKTPIILLTGMNDLEVAKKAVYLGAQDFLIKDEATGILLWRAMLYALARDQAKKEQEFLEERIHRAERLESIGVLAGGLAHDLNNILQGILNCSFLAQRNSENEVARKQLDQIETLVIHAEELISKLFTCSGKITFEYERLNLSKFILQNEASLKTCLPEIHKLIFELDADIRDIEIDPSQLRQVLINLINNGSEAIGKHNGRIIVRSGQITADKEYLEATYLDNELESGLYSFFEVQDSGSGMDANTVERIFEPFFSTKKSGRGLGLASVHGIVKNSKGAMLVDSAIGKGSTFRVIFPSLV